MQCRRWPRRETCLGATDHPAVSRYPGAVIKWHSIENYRPYRIAVGPVTGYRAIDEWVDAAGRLTRLYYELQGERTHDEVYANYRKALADAGFDIMSEGVEAGRNVGKQPGGRSWLEVYYAANVIEDTSGVVRLLAGSSTSGGSGFVAARKERAEGTIYVATAVTQYSEDVVAILVDVLEEEAAETDLVTIDAEAMGEDIDEYGKVALYGLHFAHDSAELEAESKPALDEIAKLLNARPDLSVYVVGHTDSSGALAYNRTLSESRAASVVRALVEQYGIAAERLGPHGVGPLVPVFANGSDAGRSKNRRVELVQR
ncbi:MAG: OmpA family protein [Propylenella sp.]